MWKFKAKQKIVEIGGIKLGGNPGENPTVLIGSIFYRGHRVVSDPDKGVFNEEEAGEELSKALEMSDLTGLPLMLDVVGTTPEAMKKFLDFTANNSDVPLLLDGLSNETMVEGLEYSNETGLLSRIILNSITPETKEVVLNKVKEVGLKSAVLLTYGMKAIISSKGRVEVAGELIKKAEELGLENILVDTTVLDIPTLGMATKALFEIKDKFGVPAGCGAHNAVSQWKGLKKKISQEGVIASTASSCILPTALGADFILYGPLRDAEYMFPAISLVDASFGQLLIEEKIKLPKSHPRYRIS